MFICFRLRNEYVNMLCVMVRSRAMKYVSFTTQEYREEKKAVYCMRFSTITALIGER